MNVPGPLDDLLASIVRGDPVAPAALADLDLDVLLEEAAYHGMLPLVAERLAGRAEIPARLQTFLRARANEAVVTDLVREKELKSVLVGLEAAGLSVLLIKGGQLAYSHYPRADLRPRIDTDILIPADSRSRVDDLLTRLGYACSSQVSGELVTGQSFYVKHRDGVRVHALDVHWKLASPLVFANVLSYEELAASAIALPMLGRGARGPSDIHALLIACVHRVAHHLDAVRLKWIYDIDLIARRMDDGGWGTFVELAAERHVAAVCRRSLERAHHYFGTSVPQEVAEALRLAETTTSEVTAEYLKSRPQAEALVDDLRALATWRDRMRLVREHVFPPSSYMRQVYAPSRAMPSATPLPVLYAWRFLRGAGKWLTRQG